MHEVVDFPCSNHLVPIHVSPASQTSFQKDSEEAVVETCLPWCLQGFLRRARGEKEHHVLIGIVGTSLVRAPHFPSIASIHEYHLLPSLALPHDVQNGRIIEETIIAYQSSRYAMTAEIQDDGIGRCCLGECLSHRRAYLLDSHIRIDKAFHLRLPVLRENACDGSRIIGTHPKVVLPPGVVGNAGTYQVGSG